jgi:hypothetical protein
MRATLREDRPAATGRASRRTERPAGRIQILLVRERERARGFLLEAGVLKDRGVDCEPRRRHVATHSLGGCMEDNITFCRERSGAAGEHSTLYALNHLIAKWDWSIPLHNRNPNESDRALVRLLGGGTCHLSDSFCAPGSARCTWVLYEERSSDSRVGVTGRRAAGRKWRRLDARRWILEPRAQARAWCW